MKLIRVKVVPKSSRQKVEEISPDHYKVWVHSPPEKGKANDEARYLLARYLDIPRSEIRLLKGERSRNKTFALDTEP